MTSEQISEAINRLANQHHRSGKTTLEILARDIQEPDMEKEDYHLQIIVKGRIEEYLFHYITERFFRSSENGKEEWGTKEELYLRKISTQPPKIWDAAVRFQGENMLRILDDKNIPEARIKTLRDYIVSRLKREVPDIYNLMRITPYTKN